MTTEPRLLGGRYEIGEVIGYGGMAEVHRGRDQRLGRDVAVKLLRADLSRDESFLVRFRREAQNSASLNHPNIVAVFDTGEEHGIPYMVMEFVAGRTLKEVLLAEGRFDPVTACEVVGDMCSALDFSHKHHIIHRDVKPGNVMLSDTNQVKVMDFGIARALASGQATMTQTSAVIGTAQYLSPEQARGETVDARSDVYAVGCVLYELLVGHPPFTGDNPVSVAYQHVREEARPPSELNPGVPPSVDAVVMKALSKNAEHRYSSAGEMRDDLIRAARGQEVMAAAVMSGDARTQVIGAGGPDHTEPIAPIETDASRRRPWLVALGVVAALALVGLAAFGIMRALATPPTSVVPDVVGLSQEEAESELREAELEPDVEERQADTPGDEAIGTVVEQSAEPATEIEQGSQVVITVLTAPDQVEMPDMRGENLDDARETLEGEDYRFEVTVEEQSSTEPAGTVLGQNPEADSMVDKGSEVTLTVSEGGQTEVPNVVGMVEDTAIATLESSGFGYEVRYGDGGSTVGAVYSQNPGADSVESDGTTVTITVQGVAVNWDESTTPQALQSSLASAGLNVSVEGDPDGTLIESVSGPDGGLSTGDVVAPNSSVTITAASADDDGGEDPPTCNPLIEDCDEDGE